MPVADLNNFTFLSHDAVLPSNSDCRTYPYVLWYLLFIDSLLRLQNTAPKICTPEPFDFFLFTLNYRLLQISLDSEST